MTTTTKQRLDDLATERDRLREAKRELETQVKDLDAQLAGNETDIIDIADEMGLDRFAVGKLTFSISSNVVGNVEDWDAVHAYIKENDAFYLLQRRLSNAPYKEILDSGESLPGVVPFTKRSLNMRKSA
jgi:hypothetical protein